MKTIEILSCDRCWQNNYFSRTGRIATMYRVYDYTVILQSYITSHMILYYTMNLLGSALSVVTT